MRKKWFGLIFLATITSVMASCTWFQNRSREELIVGKWKMDKNEYPYAQMSLEFNKDKTSVLERIEDNQSTLRQLYKYQLIENQKYLLLEPTEKEQKKWIVEIIQLDSKILSLRSQSPDSSLLTLRRITE